MTTVLLGGADNARSDAGQPVRAGDLRGGAESRRRAMTRLTSRVVGGAVGNAVQRPPSCPGAPCGVARESDEIRYIWR
jgi:hypothetical protein